MDAQRFDTNKFFQHRACEFFPCHEGLDPDRFNCMLCYCPLYALGEDCGGKFRYNRKGVKDCTFCTVPHDGDSGVKLVRTRFKDLAKLAARKEDAPPLSR